MPKLSQVISAVLFCFILMSCSTKEVSVAGEVFIVTKGAGNYKMGLVRIDVFPDKPIRAIVESKKSDEQSKAMQEYQKLTAEVKGLEERLEKEKSSYQQVLSSARDTIYSSSSSISDLQTAQQNLKETDWTERRIKDLTSSLTNAQTRQSVAKDNLNRSSGAEQYFNELPKSIASGTTDSDGKFSLKFPASGKYAIAAKGERTTGSKTERYYWLFWVDVNEETTSLTLSNNNLTDSGSPDSLVQTTVYE